MKASTAELAAILGITERRVQQLEPHLAKLERSEWDLAASVQGYIRYRLKAKPRSAPIGKAEERLKTAKASREELKLQLERRAVIPSEEAIAAIDDIIGTLRADLAGIPARVTRDMTWRDKIETEIDAALGRCAERFAEREQDLCPREDPLDAAAEDEPGPVGSGE